MCLTSKEIKKKVADNKSFWKTIPFFYKKVVSKEKITLAENEKIMNKQKETVEVLNTFFSSIDSNLTIAEYNNCNPPANEMSDPALKEIVEYRNTRAHSK